MTAIETDYRIKVAITIGDLNGIGLEVIFKAFADPAMLQLCTPVIYGSSKAISFHRKALNVQEFNYSTIRNLHEINPKKVNLINCWDEEVKIELGKPSAVGGRYALKSLEAACKDVADKKMDVLVTAPLDKNSVQAELPGFTGHTGFLADFFKASNPLMVLTSDLLNVAMVTGHVPLREVAGVISMEKIFSTIKTLAKTLQTDFGITKPRIAILGLNPHAGDNGAIGKEEKEVIIPAVEKASAEGLLVSGPFAADGFFGAGTYRKFDAILAMYHDQALIPFKTFAFYDGVNYTAGLPVIRTSPNHGTAYDIAGKNLANADSMRKAVYLACDLFRNRQTHASLTANPLKFSRSGSER